MGTERCEATNGGENDLPNVEYRDSILKNLCPHWYSSDPQFPTETVSFSIERGEKCMLCGQRRWFVSISEGWEPRSSHNFDVEDMALPGMTIVELDDRD